MTANELRIGNFVTLESDIDCTNPLTVNCIEDTPRIGIKESPPLWGYFSEDEIKPIPITEDWLIRFGFEKNDVGFYILILPNKNKVYLSADVKFQSFEVCQNGYGFETECSFVHQLQNLFYCLCGTEITLNTEPK